MSPTTNKPRGGKTYAELKRSRSQGTQRKLVKAQTVTSTDDPYYGGGAVFYFPNSLQFLHHVLWVLVLTGSQELGPHVHHSNPFYCDF